MADGPERGKRRLVPKLDGPVPGTAHVGTDARPLDVYHLHHAQQAVQYTECCLGEKFACVAKIHGKNSIFPAA